MTFRQAEKKFHNAVAEWAKADQECSRLYVLWSNACDRRKKLAAEKNDAWSEKEMARTEQNARLKAHVQRAKRPRVNQQIRR
jgi:hypothetical protein